MATKKYAKEEVAEHVKVLNRLGYNKAQSLFFNTGDLKKLLRTSAQIIKQLDRPTTDYS